MTQGGPNIPEPAPISIPRAGTLVGVLDLGSRSEEPDHYCRGLLPGVSAFLERARASGVPIFYTIVAMERDTPFGTVAKALNPRPDEPVVFSNTFDKFAHPEARALIEGRNPSHLVLLGGATTFAVLYTATTAANIYRYQVVVPVDGVAAHSRYEQDYALHQMAVLPPRAIQKIAFTRLQDIVFE